MESKSKLKLKPVTVNNLYFLFELRNIDSIRPNFFNSNIIPWEDHYIYWVNRISNNKVSYIIEYDNEDVGVVKLDNIDNHNHIGIIIHPIHSGKGIGKKTINELKKRYNNLVADVMLHNLASLKLFEKCGFKAKCIVFEQDDDSA